MNTPSLTPVRDCREVRTYRVRSPGAPVSFCPLSADESGAPLPKGAPLWPQR